MLKGILFFSLVSSVLSVSAFADDAKTRLQISVNDKDVTHQAKVAGGEMVTALVVSSTSKGVSGFKTNRVWKRELPEMVKDVKLKQKAVKELEQNFQRKKVAAELAHQKVFDSLEPTSTATLEESRYFGTQYDLKEKNLRDAQDTLRKAKVEAEGTEGNFKQLKKQVLATKPDAKKAIRKAAGIATLGNVLSLGLVADSLARTVLTAQGENAGVIALSNIEMKHLKSFVGISDTPGASAKRPVLKISILPVCDTSVTGKQVATQ